MTNPFCDIIIPSFNNYQQLVQTLQSIFMSMTGPLSNLVRVIVVNNGDQKLKGMIAERYNLKIIDVGENLGWEGGLLLGLEQSKSPFVIFANDDIRLLQGNKKWFWQTMAYFNDPAVGAVGPCSNYVMGPQNIFMDTPLPNLDVKFLIGFFMVLRREALVKAGSVDTTLPGGDDIDLSIRLRDAGYRLICARDMFVYHHGSQTGARVHGGYWNSPQMQENTNMALIKKHGMLKFWQTMVMGGFSFGSYGIGEVAETDVEGDLCRKWVLGEHVLELGCGGRKTVERAIGVDFHEAGEKIPFVAEGADSCVADISADASRDIPLPARSQDTIIARHILEHCQDPLGTLSHWNQLLRIDGRLVVAVPNNGLGNTIMMNPEHIVSFVPESLKKMASACGFKEVFRETAVNGVVFVMVFEKQYESMFPQPEKTVSPKASQLMEVVA